MILASAPGRAHAERLRVSPPRASFVGASAALRVYAVLTEARPAAARKLAREAAAGGVRLFQVRAKRLASGARAEVVRSVGRGTRGAGRCLVIVNDDPLAALLGAADGAHLGREDGPLREARELLGAGGVLGATVHSAAEADDAAAQAGVIDYVGVGAIHASGTKPDRAPRGLEVLREAAMRLPRTPIFAIGGLTPERFSEVLSAGAFGVAVGGAIQGAASPRRAAQACLEAVAAHLRSLRP